MRKIDWVFLGLILLSLFYTRYGFGVWRDSNQKSFETIARDVSAINNRLDVRANCEAKWDAEITGMWNKIHQIDDRTKYMSPSYGEGF